MIEAKTYRHGGHSRADPAKYRPDDEVAAWMKKDPLPMYRARLLAGNEIDGPAIIQEAGSATCVPAGVHVVVDVAGHLILTVEKA